MILHKLMRKGRRKNLPLNMRYYVLYAFLYKYMSDKLKNHLMYYLAGDEAAHAAMLRAANTAGRAINITQTTAGHAMCYKVTSLYGAAHGHTEL